MRIQASTKHIRMAPKKIRLVIDLVRGMGVEEAERQLRFMNKAAAKPVLKLLLSAIANAEHNFKLQKSDLFIEKIIANEGMALKRFTPKAFGRGTSIYRRSSHIHITLAPKKGTKVVTEAKVESGENAVVTEEKKPVAKKKTTSKKAKS